MLSAHARHNIIIIIIKAAPKLAITVRAKGAADCFFGPRTERPPFAANCIH